jgi:type VI secretion system protein ImpG
MQDNLLLYYERELTHLRQMAVQFAEKYPKVASRLSLEATKCEDPHVERLLEAFAFLAARVHLKVDDDFPEISEAILTVAYPHLTRPVPSMSVVEFQLDLQQGKLSSGLPVPRHSVLYSRPVGGVPCVFRTCYDATLWPASVVAAEWTTPDRLQPAIKATDAAGAIRIELRGGPDVKFPDLQMNPLRFYLHGESALTHILYELLCCNLTRIVIRDPTPLSKVKPVTLPASSLVPIGFAADEGLLPYSPRSFLGYRVLQEYFAFPEKFFFFDLKGLDEVWKRDFQGSAELIFMISKVDGEERRQRLEMGVSATTFRLGCTPIINLFPQTAEPIQLNQRKYEYQVTPDVRRPFSTEIFSIDEVATLDPQTHETRTFEPFYSFRHASQREKKQCFWIAARRQSHRLNDEATDMFMSFVDLSMRPLQPDVDTITVRTTCTNRDLPSRLPFGKEDGDFELEGISSIKKIVALQKPTPPLRPPLGKSALWRLISHLSLNYLSLVEEGREALQQILRLYNFTDSAFAQKVIEGIADVKSRRHFARVVSESGISFARGTRVELELDEEQFVGGGAYLFASVLEEFLAQYVSLNSFSQLVATTRQRKEVLREWPPRAGRKILM